MNTLYKVALTLVIIGAINWGMVGIFNVNLVSLIFGVDSILSNIIYALVGISGLITSALLLKDFDTNNAHN